VDAIIKDFAPWESVYYYFRKWKRDGLIEETHDILVEKVRIGIGKNSTLSVGNTNLCRRIN